VRCARRPGRLSRIFTGMSFLERVARRIGNDRFLKVMRFYPPYLGAGIAVTRVAADLSVVEVEMKLSAWNRNFVGTQFGGSLYSSAIRSSCSC
jgi:uncharacterized protein DUF4442